MEFRRFWVGKSWMATKIVLNFFPNMLWLNECFRRRRRFCISRECRWWLCCRRTLLVSICRDFSYGRQRSGDVCACASYLSFNLSGNNFIDCFLLSFLVLLFKHGSVQIQIQRRVQQWATFKYINTVSLLSVKSFLVLDSWKCSNSIGCAPTS